MNEEINRLNTFINWTAPADRGLLARTGFYFIGGREEDLTKCYFCHVEIGMWQPEDNPVDEHIKWSPNCPLMRGRETTNDPINPAALQQVLPRIVLDPTFRRRQSLDNESRPAEHFEHSSNQVHRHPEFAIERLRLLSFEDWPKHMKPTPRELADAGFYYTGKGDRVACFSCGGGLKDWAPTDVPWHEHASWYSDCVYLKLVKGTDFITRIIANRDLSSLRATTEMSEKSLLTSETSSDNMECKICYENDCIVAFIPCGHVACAKCATTITKCHLCLQPFTPMRIYLK